MPKPPAEKPRAAEVRAAKAEAAGFNLRVFGPDEVGLSFGETVTREDLVSILEDVFGVDSGDVPQPGDANTPESAPPSEATAAE